MELYEQFELHTNFWTLEHSTIELYIKSGTCGPICNSIWFIRRLNEIRRLFIHIRINDIQEQTSLSGLQSTQLSVNPLNHHISHNPIRQSLFSSWKTIMCPSGLLWTKIVLPEERKRTKPSINNIPKSTTEASSLRKRIIYRNWKIPSWNRKMVIVTKEIF